MNPYAMPGIQTPPPPSIEMITEILTELTGIAYIEAKGKCRKPLCVVYRWAFWYTVKKYHPEMTLERLGLYFYRDHCTVIFGLQKCENKYEFLLQSLLASVLTKMSEKGY